ncbi:MAG: AAA family ATPase [Candidatus Pacebacteria bacterium]|nr:AAA family ATPase [Candidatus Paceibacterota bacterium]MBT3512098.1 AAA family ATPase [Candidatus Paceibacterota bacterium]MBT4005217.1 AAA family ATPase [Candidatus Paceibacterota bacterium]MBT4358361.1 AAA family ATPase [Candidatus Paceibacterota bacterium]MBT4680777.1 AAA family ATPase [Candidatus Paceibacterota bacterium]
MKLSADQRQALEKIIKWLRTPNRSPNYFTFGGYAGTGKTTLTALLRQILHKKNPKLKVALVSYTGKAARVLKSTLIQQEASYKQDTVGTIHSLIYEPVVNSKSDIVGWNKKQKVDVKLIIVDEASMVNYDIWQDLLSFDIPILAIGDHGQLPPIEGKFNLMKKPNVKLEKIHRQAENNPIIKLSIQARKTGKVLVGNFGPHIEKLDQSSMDTQEKIQDLLKNFNQQTMILTGYNSTRVKINEFIRQHKFFDPSPEPMVGDRVICLRNNHAKHIYNGMLGEITFLESINENHFYAEIKLDENQTYKGNIYKKQFGSIKPKNYTKGERKLLKGIDLFDFGYALTVHKAQGSQAKRVILFEERFKQMDDEQWRRWLYTGITRAEEELYIVGTN